MSFVAIKPLERLQAPIILEKDHYIIVTFLGKMTENTNDTINYYYQKYYNFIRNANAKINQQLSNMQSSVPSIGTLFNQAFANYNINVSKIWSMIQNTDTQTLRSRVAAFNSYTQQLQSQGQTVVDFYQFLNYMSNNSIPAGTQIPGVINIQSISSFMNDFLNPKVVSSKSLGGHRGRLFGEVFEQGTNSMIAANVANLLAYIQVGNQNSILPNKTVAQGKTDGMFFADSGADGGIVQHTQTFYKNPRTRAYPTYATTKNQSIELEASTLFDLSTKNGLTSALATYTSIGSARGSMIGTSVKAWTGSKGSFGSFSISAREINNRSDGSRDDSISTYFDDIETFKLYNEYVVSKYLINIIGAYNAIMVTGDEILPTYQWLYNLYSSSLRIRHSIMRARKMSVSGYGEHYYVSNKLAVTTGGLQTL